MRVNKPYEAIEYLGHGADKLKLNIGDILLSSGKVKPIDIERIMELQHREGWRFGESALHLRLISEKDLIQALYRQYDLPPILSDSSLSADELVTVHDPNHRRSEEFRTLRTQLLTHWLRHGSPPAGHIGKALAIVSPGDGEGRSYVTANLAVLFSQIGERTLLIDADMRHPAQHRIFNLEDRIGLSTVLAGRAGVDAAQAIPGLPNLFVLPAGAPPPNPQELLSRPAMATLIGEYMHDFDVILIDTPAALPFADANAISFCTGHAIVLARKDHTRLADVSRVTDDLMHAGTHVVGNVFNNF